MGNYSKGANGTISGKFGSVVGSSWRGIDYLKGLPKKSKKAPSAKQLAIQAKFALTAAQLSPIKDVLYIGFNDKKLSELTGYNAAARIFLANAIIGEYPNYSVDYSKMKLSKNSGIAGILKGATLAIGENNTLVLNWLNVIKRNTFADDGVMVVVYNATSKLYEVYDAAVRADGELQMEVDVDENDVLHVWVFCISRDGLSVSPTTYVGTITMSN